MIFYSDQIEADIIDNNALDVIADKVDEFKEDINMLFTYFTYSVIGLDYTQNLLKYKSNRVAFYCMDDVFDIRNCPTAMIYSKQVSGDEIVYYIMIICTQRRFKNLGYATALLNGFVEKIRQDTEKPVKIVLSALDEVVSYYQKYGFEVVDCTLENYPHLARFEKYDETKIYTIMEMKVSDHSGATI